MSSGDKTEAYIIKGLLSFPDYAARFLEKLDKDFFSDEGAAIVRTLQTFHNKYSKIPSLGILCDKELPKFKPCSKNPEFLSDCEEYVHSVVSLKVDKDKFYEYLCDETKQFIKTKRIENSLVELVQLMDQGKTDEAVKAVLDAASVHFDESLGLDYFEDLESRIEKMKSPDSVIPSGIDALDEKIGGGWHRKGLVIFGAATNVGKTLILGDIACKLVNQGLNGLYVSLEINENILANRIDANLTDISMSDLYDDPDRLMAEIMARKKQAEDTGNEFGRFIIKEYPPATMNANQLLSLVRELELKRNGFKPDFICVDYLGLMIPNGKGFSDNTYGKLKTAAEELRAVGCILDVPIFSAVQINREGFNESHIGLDKTADSIGIPMTADLMFMISRTEDMAANNQIYFNVAKSRYSKNGDGLYLKVDYDHMRIYDENQEADDKKKISLGKKLRQLRSGGIN